MSDLDPKLVADDFRDRYLRLKGPAGGFVDEGEPLFVDYARFHPALAHLSETQVRKVWAEVWAADEEASLSAFDLESEKAINATMLERAGGNPDVQVIDVIDGGPLDRRRDG